MSLFALGLALLLIGVVLWALLAPTLGIALVVIGAILLVVGAVAGRNPRGPVV